METASQVQENCQTNGCPSLEQRDETPEMGSGDISNDPMDVTISGFDTGEKRNTLLQGEPMEAKIAASYLQDCQTTDSSLNELSSEHEQGEPMETGIVGSDAEDRFITANSILKESSRGEKAVNDSKVVLGVPIETTMADSNTQNCQTKDSCNNELSFEHVGGQPMETRNVGSDSDERSNIIGNSILKEGTHKIPEVGSKSEGAPTETKTKTAGSDTHNSQTMDSCDNVLCFESVQGQTMETKIVGINEEEKCHIIGNLIMKEKALGGKPELDSQLGMETRTSEPNPQNCQIKATCHSDLGSDHVQAEPMETKSVGSDSVDVGVSSEHVKGEPVDTKLLGSNSVDVGLSGTPTICATENSNGPGHKEGTVSSRSRKRKSELTSPGTARALRPRLNGLCKTPDPIVSSANVTVEREKKRKKRKRTQKELDNEFSKIRKRVRYLLTRMGYEHNFIDAYSGEGWKGQSVEKIKPEKELQRASSEILRCKRRIRELFQHLDSLCAEGRFQEALFDDDGQISSEDIFCAKCGSEDLSADNDIILCDGICDRGFHQMCLEPPLLKEEIPPGDEGWLCPGCDCKVDCFDLLNDSQGTDLSVEDSWEKVFPEAAVREAGDVIDAIAGLPSDDSEDDEYNPDASEVEERVHSEGSSSDDSDDSDFTSDSDSDSDELGVSTTDNQYLGLPSDDSEDDDYDPTAPDPEKTKEESSSSDFTSASEYFSASSDPNLSSGAEDSGPPCLVNGSKLPGSSNRRSEKARNKKPSVHSEVLSVLEPNSQGDPSQMLEKRQLERLDYKKLHDEAYGNVPSDSSDDEDWDEADYSPNKNDGLGEGSSLTPEANSRTIMGRGNTKRSQNRDSKETENTSKRRTRQKNVSEGANNSEAETCIDRPEPDLTEKSATGLTSKILEPAVSKEEPSSSPKADSQTVMGRRSTKRSRRSDSNETGNTSKRRTRQTKDSESAKESAAEMCVDSPEPNTIEDRRTASTYKTLGQAVTEKLYESFKQNEYPTRDTKETLAKELGITFQQVDKWFGNARRSSRRSSINAVNSSTKASPTMDQSKLVKPETNIVPNNVDSGKSEDREVSKEETPKTTSNEKDDNVDLDHQKLNDASTKGEGGEVGEPSTPKNDSSSKCRETVISIPAASPKTENVRRGRKANQVVVQSQIQTRSRKTLAPAKK